MTITSIQDKVTRTSAANGSSVDISATALATTDWTLVVDVQALADDNVARLVFEDSVDAFTAKLAGPSVSISGKRTVAGSSRFTFKKHDFPSLRFGVTSAVLRLALAEIKGGSSQSITYSAWLEY